MEPGKGAEEQARRHARRLEGLRAEHARTGSAESWDAVRRAEEQVRRWSTGAQGERDVADALPALRAHGWTALHDVRWPDRPRANLDHIALGPGGVVVIDTKNWTGSVDVQGGELRQNGYRRAREVDGVAEAVAAVTALLEPTHRMAVRGVLCLAAQDVEPVATASGVTVVGLPGLASHLTSMPPRLSPYEVADIGRFLAAELDPVGDRRPRAARTARTSRRPVRATASRHPRGRAGRPHPVLRVLVALLVLWALLGAVSSVVSDSGRSTGTGVPQPASTTSSAPAAPTG